MEKSVWKDRIRAHTSAKGLELYYRIKREVYTKKSKGIFIIKRRMRRSTGICGGPAMQKIYPTIKVTINISSSLCSQKE